MPRTRPPQPSSNFRARLAIFAVLALALLGGAAYTLWPKELPVVVEAPATTTTHAAVTRTLPPTASATDLTLRIDMGGFTPANLTIPANRTVRVRIVNPDNSHHSDGGGMHQFAVDRLGLDVKIRPETIQVITIPPTPEGEYAFYCDVCCGGKENPSMQGRLTVKA